MKINISFAELESMMNDCFYSWEDYMHSSIRYYREHGYGVNLDRAKTVEERHIVYAHENDRSASNAFNTFCNILCMDSFQQRRLLSAFRAVRRWYCRTNWERCLPSEVEDRILEYIFG